MAVPKSYHFLDSVYSGSIFDNMHNFQCNGILCDVIIMAEGREIPAHKVVLAASSEYFKAMFTNDLKESKQDKITLQRISFPILKIVIDFFYTRKITLTEENVCPILELADQLQVTVLHFPCYMFMVTSMDEDNCLQYYNEAKLLSNFDLAAETFNICRRKFSQIRSYPLFCEVPYDTLQDLLNSPVLAVESEADVLQAVIDWVQYDQSREKYLPDLLQAICKSQIEFHNIDIRNQIIENEIKILTENTSQSPPARYFKEQLVLFVVGGKLCEDDLSSVECLTDEKVGWKSCLPIFWLPQNKRINYVIPGLNCARSAHAVASLDTRIFVIGGIGAPDVSVNPYSESELSSVECYNITENTWSSLKDIPIPLVYCATVIVGCSHLTVIGGAYQLVQTLCPIVREEILLPVKYVWMLNIKTENSSWQEGVPMKESRFGHCAVNLAGYVYAMGGMGGVDQNEKTHLNSMEMYDSTQKHWRTVSPMAESRAHFGAVACEGKIFAIGGVNISGTLSSTEVYDPLANQWTTVSPMFYPRQKFAAVLCHHRIFCIGGEDSMHYLGCVLKYNTRTNRWHSSTCLQMKRTDFSGAALTVPVDDKADPI